MQNLLYGRLSMQTVAGVKYHATMPACPVADPVSTGMPSHGALLVVAVRQMML
jgi:hypothetical protein